MVSYNVLPSNELLKFYTASKFKIKVSIDIIFNPIMKIS